MHVRIHIKEHLKVMTLQPIKLSIKNSNLQVISTEENITIFLIHMCSIDFAQF